MEESLAKTRSRSWRKTPTKWRTALLEKGKKFAPAEAFPAEPAKKQRSNFHRGPDASLSKSTNGGAKNWEGGLMQSTAGQQTD